MNKNILKFIKIFQYVLSTSILIIFSNSLLANDNANFKQVEATGRAVLIAGDIETSRKRALEDALYIAALKGGADINGFSAITSNTVINDQSIVKATNRVLDFKILSEKQSKEFLSIKISAVVGGKLSKKNCKNRPINITLFRGSYNVESSVPSKLARYTPMWYGQIYDVISKLPNVKAINHKNKSLKQIIKSKVNSSFDYNALTNGLPIIQAGDYSLVPELLLTENNNQNSFSNYLLKVSFKIFKGPGIKLMTTKTYDLPIEYQYKSKFQFINNISTSDIQLVDQNVHHHMLLAATKFLQDLNCRPLEGKLTVNEGSLVVDLGRKQGLKQKQIGLVKGINIQNSMLNNSSVIVHTNKIYDNYSILLPLNDNVKLSNLDNMIVEFVE
ncbi:MAG: flagellar assembly protein T N-terminal domain-containing protein [Candidatus Puniceispirillales bacterium]